MLKLATPTSSGPESLPVVGRLTGALLSHFESNRLKNEPERRHSSYDPARQAPAGTGVRVSCRAGGQQQQQPSSAININGLPDPFRLNGQSTSVYSSQESLHRGTGTPLRPTSSTGTKLLALTPFRSSISLVSGSTRPGAGTPQSHATPSGAIRTSANGLIPSSSTTTANLNNTRTTLTSLFHKDHQDSTTMNQTPSPSDSAVGDLETILKEKDTEINYLRETMEQNEQVIFKVSQKQFGVTKPASVHYLLVT